jgi:hypothetical protein
MTGFSDVQPPSIRMEEETEETSPWPGRRPTSMPIGFALGESAPGNEDDQEQEQNENGKEREGEAERQEDGLVYLLRTLMDERQQILTSDLRPRQKFKLLEANRRTMVILRGGHVLATENVVYALLGVSAVVLVLLATLTTFSDLPSEVTLTFVGTVVGGLIATVAQKIGRI